MEKNHEQRSVDDDCLHHPAPRGGRPVSPGGSRAGYAGCLAVVDLTSGTAAIEGLPPGLVDNYIGGRGLACRLLVDRLVPRCEPLDRDNLLVFTAGPLTGMGLPFTGCLGVATKSPLTGLFCYTTLAGTAAVDLRRVGLDAVIIRGQSPRPVCLVVGEGRVDIVDDDGLWGLPAPQAGKELQTRYGGDGRTSVCVIGPAGERLVRFAGIEHGGHTTGRGGPGAVMGAKRVKALVIRDASPLRQPTPALSQWLEPLRRRLLRQADGVAGALMRRLLELDKAPLPAQNFRAVVFCPGLGATLGGWTTMQPGGCDDCPVACRPVTTVPGSPEGEDCAVGLDPVNVAALGPLCGVDDPAVVVRAAWLCHRWGLDPVSAGAAVAFAMEGSGSEAAGGRGRDRGGGIRFGDGAAALELLESIAQRRGPGDALAQGVCRAARVLGREDAESIVHVHGMEFPAVDPRCHPALIPALATLGFGEHFYPDSALSPATWFGTRGGRSGGIRGAGAMTALAQEVACLMDMLGICRHGVGAFAPAGRFQRWWRRLGTARFAGAAPELALLGWGLGTAPRAFNAATGRRLASGQVRSQAALVIDSERVFNIREGFQPRAERLPARFHSVPDGPGHLGSASVPVRTEAEVEAAVQEYYRVRGWSRDGLPEF